VAEEILSNTAHCRLALRARGVAAPTINLGTPTYQGSGHLGSSVAGTAAIVRWFTQLR
jgi:hypothetical protein